MTVDKRALPRHLVDAVMDVRCLRDQEIVRQIVNRLCPDLRSALDSTAGTSPRGLIVSMMEDLCTRPAGLAQLVESLELREGNSGPIRMLKVATAAWEVELLDQDDWDELFMLLDGLRIPDLDRRYASFLRGLGRPPAAVPCAEPWAAFLHAATLNARPGEQLPCFQVLQQLLTLGADGERQHRIVDWAEQRDPYRTEQHHQASSKEPTASAEPAFDDSGVWDPPDYLIIRLRPLLSPDTPSGTDMLLTHWLRLHPGDQVKGEDLRIGLRDAEEEVANLVFRVESDLAYRRDELALEFVLPGDLLDLSVERWRKRSFQGVGGVLGEDHHVVVRSFDRLDRRDLHGRWSRRWDAFAKGRAGRVHWFPEDGHSHLLSDPPPAVVVLSGAPGGARGEAGVHGSMTELGEALRVGVPVVLWDRRGHGDPLFQAALQSLLGRHDPRLLPGVVRALRIAAIDRDPEEDGIVGRHVALLWDDPNRMPVSSAGALTVSPSEGEEEL